MNRTAADARRGLAFWQNLTLANFRFVLLDYDVTRRAIANSLILAVASASLAVLLGALVGWIDLRTRMPGRRFLDYVSLVPLGLPGIVMAVASLSLLLMYFVHKQVPEPPPR